MSAALSSMHGAPAAVAGGLDYNKHNTPALLLKQNIQIKQLQHTYGTQLKYSKYASETHAKTHEKHLKNNCKHMQHPDKTLATYV